MIRTMNEIVKVNKADMQHPDPTETYKLEYGKPALGRGLLDVWNAEYQRRFGSTIGTAGAHEISRRKVVTNLTRPEK
jgi:hypothetical protein